MDHAEKSKWPVMSGHYDKVLDVIGLGIPSKDAFLMSNKELDREINKPVVDYTVVNYGEIEEESDWE